MLKRLALQTGSKLQCNQGRYICGLVALQLGRVTYISVDTDRTKSLVNAPVDGGLVDLENR